MSRIHHNFVSGHLSSGIGSTDTTIESGGLSRLPVVTGGDVAVLVIDPFGADGTPEIVFVTDHAASATTATVLRGQDTDTGGGPPRSHQPNIFWAHVPVASTWSALLSDVGGLKNEPGSVLATAAPVPIVAGGTTQTGSAVAISRADHRHSLAAGTAGPSAPGDSAAAGTSTEVARADHRHQREPFAPVGVIEPVGTTALAGTSQALARGDHRHTIGSGAINNAAMFGTNLQPTLTGTSNNRPGSAPVGTRYYETNTGRLYVYRASGWRWLASDTAEENVYVSWNPPAAALNSGSEVNWGSTGLTVTAPPWAGRFHGTLTLNGVEAISDVTASSFSMRLRLGTADAIHAVRGYGPPRWSAQGRNSITIGQRVILNTTGSLAVHLRANVIAPSTGSRIDGSTRIIVEGRWAP